MKSEYSKPITVGMLMYLNKKYGMTVEINSGEVTGLFFEETQRGAR